MCELARDRSLHPAVLLKSLVAFKSDFSAARAAQPRLADRDFTPGKDDVAGLSPMPVSALLAVRAAALNNLLLQKGVDDFQAGLRAERFDLGFGLEDDFEHRQLDLKPGSFEVQFGAGFGQRTIVLFVHAVVGFGFC